MRHRCLDVDRTRWWKRIQAQKWELREPGSFDRRDLKEATSRIDKEEFDGGKT
jgi:hypothetical protein